MTGPPSAPRRLRAEHKLAEAARSEAEEVSEFLVGLFAVSDPRHARGGEVAAIELLDTGAGRIAELDGRAVGCRAGRGVPRPPFLTEFADQGVATLRRKYA